MLYLPTIAVHFLYIAIIILCTVTATLYVSMTFKRSEAAYKTITVLAVAMLAYTITEMFTASFVFALLPQAGVHISVVASDVAFFVIVAAWVNMLILLSGNPYIISGKGISVYTAVYAIVVEIMAVLAYSIPAMYTAILVTNVIFDLTVCCIGIVFLKYAVSGMKEDTHKVWVIGLSTTLLLYMLYTSFWDVCSGTINQGTTEKYSDFDPIFIFYVFVCVSVIWILVRRGDSTLGFDISKTIGIDKQREFDWKVISEKYRLTMREIEVCQLVCKGMNNPDIAEFLFISENTVKHHLGNIYKKTKSKGRYELIKKLNP